MKKFLLLLFAVSGMHISLLAQLGKSWPLIEKTIVLHDNTRISYVEQGNPTGVPVILLHGYTDSWHSFETVLQYLPSDIHAFAISQRGHGDSDRPAFGYDMRSLAADVAQFVNKLELGYVIVVGHSMGGIVAQRFMLDYPSLTRGVVIAGSTSSFNKIKLVHDFQDAVHNLKDPVDYSFILEFQKSTVVKPVDQAYFNRLVNESTKVPARVWKSAMDGFMNVNYATELTVTRTPVLILWGSKDIICSRSSQTILNKSIRDSKLIVYKNTGHAIHWEEPKRFAGDLVSFIADTDKWKINNFQ